MAKQLTFSEEARAAMKRGIDTMADTVGVTLGPRGRNVVLDKKFADPFAPKSVPDAPAPNADPISAPLPFCNKINTTMSIAVIT